MAKRDRAAEKAESVDAGALVDTESAARKLDAEEVEDIDGQDAAADDAKDVADQGPKIARGNGFRVSEA